MAWPALVSFFGHSLRGFQRPKKLRVLAWVAPEAAFRVPTLTRRSLIEVHNTVEEAAHKPFHLR